MKKAGKWIAWLLLALVLAEGVLAEENSEDTPAQVIISAMEVYSWFTISPLDVDPELPIGEGNVFRVADETLCRYETVMKILEANFSREIIEEMLAYDIYQVVDGVLYGDGMGRGIDPNISEVEYETVSADDQKVVYRVTVHYVGEGEADVTPDAFEFVRERSGEQWVFTQFPFFW